MTDTLESLRDWILTTIVKINEMGRDDPPQSIIAVEEYIKHTSPRRAANGRFNRKV